MITGSEKTWLKDVGEGFSKHSSSLTFSKKQSHSYILLPGLIKKSFQKAFFFFFKKKKKDLAKMVIYPNSKTLLIQPEAQR